jgi:MATE family multidrug resistance protein
VLAGLMMGWIGTQSLAAHQIAIQCAATSFMLTLGLAVAVCVRVGHAVGAGQLRRVRRIGGVGLALAAAFMGVVAALFILFNGNIAGWFVDEPELVALTASLLWIAAFFQIADGIQVVASNALRGMGDVRVPAVIALFCYWGAQIPFAALMGFHFKLGAPGIWWGLVAGLVLSAIWLTARFLRLSRRLEKPPPAPR